MHVRRREADEEQRPVTLERLDERLIHVEQMLADYVTRHEFTPVQLIAYGAVSLLAGGVFTVGLAKLFHLGG